MTEKEAYGQAFENGRKLGYEEGKRDAVKHGEWIEDYETIVDDSGRETYPVQTGYVCSECEKDGDVNWRFCPNCGARMDGDGNEREAD